MKKILIIILLIQVPSLYADYQVSDMNGDLSYKYPISSNLVKGHNLEVDITYNSNIPHVSLVHYLEDEKEFIKYSLPMPLWTINVNGFVVNALSHKINPYNSIGFRESLNLPDVIKDSPDPSDHYYGYKKYWLYNNIWLIEGYDYCNRLSILEEGDSDEIKLLRSDGSVLNLKNSDRVGQYEDINDPKFYTGLYYHDSYNTNIYAKVEFDSTSHFPEYITKHISDSADRVQYYPRVLKVYMGDGLEYVFREWISPYGARMFNKVGQKNQHDSIYNSYTVKYKIIPTIFYMDQINTSIGELTSFTRDHHNFNNDEVDLYKGHAWTTDFYGHHIDYYHSEDFVIDAFGKSYRIKNIVEPCHFFRPRLNIFDSTYLNMFYKEIFENDDNYKGLNLLQTMDKGNLLMAKDTSLDYNISTSLKSGYIDEDEYFPSRYMGRYFRQYISDIYDPEGNKVKFDYQNVYKTQVNDALYGSDYVDFFAGFKRLKRIENNSKEIHFNYYGGITYDESVVSSEMESLQFHDEVMEDNSEDVEYYDFFTSFYEDDKYKFKVHRTQINSIDNIVEKEKILGEIKDTLSVVSYDFKFRYAFDDMRDTKIHIENKKLDLSTTILTMYQFWNIYPYNYDSNKDKPFDVPMKFQQYIYNNCDSDSCEYNNFDEVYHFDNYFVDDNGGSSLFMYPTRTKKYVFYEDTLYLTEHKEYDYEFTTYDSFDGNIEFANKFGRVIKKQVIENYYPDSNDVIRNKIEREYYNLPRTYETLYNVNDSILDYRKTYKENLKNWRKGVESNLIYIDNEVKDIEQIKPPILGLLKSVYSYDRNDDIINGSINTIELHQTGNYPSARRGVILNDSIVGRYGNKKLLNNKYEYNGSRYNSQIKYIIGINNDTTELDYNYSSSGKVSSQKWKNNEQVENVDLYKIFPFFDLPIKEVKSIKYYNEDGNLFTKKLSNFMEYNSIGLATKMVDYNGNFTLKQYDKIGRELQVNLPYDFPATNQIYLNNDNCVPLDKQVTIKKIRQDTVVYTDSIPKINIGNWNNLDTISYDLDLERYTDITFESKDTILGFNNHILNNYKSVVEITYKASDSDVLHTSNPDSVNLRVSFVGNNINNCTGINVKTNKYGFEKQFLLGCVSMFSLPNIDTSNIENNSNELLYIDLSEIKDSMANMSNNEELTFSFEVNSSDGNMQIQSFNEDNDICITASAGVSSEKKDFTYKNIFNDENQTIERLTKVDDFKYPTHSYKKGFDESFSDHDGRYFKNITYKDSDNDSYKNETYVGKPDSYDRIDSTYKEYDPVNNKVLSYDILGKVSSTKINSSNRNDTIINYNDTVRTEVKYGFENDYDNYIFYKNKYDLQDDFHGYLKQVSTKVFRNLNSGNNIYTYEFYDALDRLRAKVNFGEIETPQIDTFKITYFNYNIIGQLTEVVNNNDDTTKYVYDDFGNIKYKYQKDKGLSSYRYSDNGQLRFSQNQLQADENKVNYYQYDDLGRKTIVGEAKITETGLGLEEADYPSDLDDVFRLTDTLNPNIINDGISSVLTANKSLLDNTNNPVKLNYTMDTTSVNPDYLYFPEDSLNQQLLILQNSVKFDEPNLTSIAHTTFENIKDNPQTVLQAMYYDTIPVQKGNVFGKMPDYTKWDTLNQNWSNLKGNMSVMAYRNNSDQNFNFVRYSYDARSRVRKMIRYTENLGFDGVYYDYNSLNQVTSITVIDPLRSFKMWYSYDQNGRVDSVWAKVDSIGTGFGVNGKLHQPEPVVRDINAIFYYSYTKRGSIDTVIFTPHNIIKKFSYSDYGWLDSIKVLKDDIMMYGEIIGRDDYGNVNSITDKFDENDPMKIFTSEFTRNRHNELTEWKMNSITKEKFTYDNIGNRLTKQINSFTQNYNYGSGLNSNKLFSVDYQSYQKQITYNSVGAISSTLDSLYGASPVLMEEFDYNNFNRLRQYIQYDTSGIDYSSCIDSRQEDYWDWRYNYSPTSGMESKKMFNSPQGNNCNTHAFTYYLQGANGEMFVEFNGKQWSKDTLTQTGNRIYYYAKAYNIPGTNFRFKLNEMDSSKFDDFDLFIQDHNGATKLLLNKTSNVLDPGKKYLNYPYGDTLKTAMVGHYDSDLNAFGELKNHEMPYSIMGFRIYSEEIGRFLSPDPLFEKFAEWTPYHFAFNNPIMYSDPSGLEPKKEKSEAKLLVAPDNHFDDAGLFAMLNNMFEQQMKALKLRQDEELGKAIGLWNSFCRWKDDMWNKSQGGGRLGSGEKVNSTTTTLDKSNNKKKASKEKVNKETGKIDFESDDARNEKKERLRQKLQFKGGTSEEQEKTLDYLTDHVPEEYMETGRIITIDIGLDASGIATLYKDLGYEYESDILLGLHRAVEGIIYLPNEFIKGTDTWSYIDENGNYQGYKLWMVVAHEFGHEKDFYRCFYDCGLYYIYPVEEGADREANKLRQEYGYPINKQFYRSK